MTETYVLNWDSNSTSTLNETTWDPSLFKTTTTIPSSSSPTEDAIFFEHPEQMLIPWVVNIYFFPIVFTYIITFIIGVSGNIVAISVMTGDRTSRNVTSIFLVSLAVADLLLLVICAPLDVAHYFVVQWDTAGTVCKLAAYAEMLSAFASVLNLVAVTLERFVVIVFPIQSRSLCTMSNCKRLLVVVWLVSILLAIPVFGTKNTVKSSFTNHVITVTLFSCKEVDDWWGYTVAIYRVITLFALPSVLMIFCYAWVITELWLSTKTMDELTNAASDDTNWGRPASRISISHDQTSPASNRRFILRTHANSEFRDVKRARQQVIKMLILVVVLFLICWGPRLIMEIVLKCCIDDFSLAIYVVRFVFYLLPFVHSCLNPIVYCFMSTKFRRRMMRCFERTCGATFVSLCCPKQKGYKHQVRIKSSMSRNGTSRVGSTYTFTSYAASSTCSPSGDFQSRLTYLETITL